MLSQILIAIIIVILVSWLIRILFTKNFWKTVGDHVVNGIAKKISNVFIVLIILSVVALIASILKK